MGTNLRGDRSNSPYLGPESMHGVRLQRAAQHRSPARGQGFFSKGKTRQVDALDHAASRRFTLEVAGIDLETVDGAGGAQPDDRPIVAWAAAAAGLPSIGHASRRPGLDQIVARAEEHIAAGLDDRAILESGKIDRSPVLAQEHNSHVGMIHAAFAASPRWSEVG
jgi:hypothetical protein